MDGGQPRSGQPYVLFIDGIATEGELDDEGGIEISIPPGALEGVLRVGDPPQEYRLQLGHLDPITTVAGVQARLNSVGYVCGAVDGVIGSQTSEALQRFQRDEGLEVTGKIDQATTDALQSRFGC
jgi:N-acetylmuramoyl-L-alanine amidase